jgi:hypothetical protein
MGDVVTGGQLRDLHYQRCKPLQHDEGSACEDLERVYRECVDWSEVVGYRLDCLIYALVLIQ